MKKKLLIFIILLSIFMVNNVYATEIIEASDNITQKGDYNSTRFIAGNNISSKANIDGLFFVAGNQIKLEGKSTYDFIAGNNIIIEENIEKDIFAAGNNITIDKNAIISRDAYLMGSTITINTNIGRDLRVGAEKIDLSGITINGDAYLESDNIILNNDTIIKGKLTYNENAKVKGLKEATIGKIKVNKIKNITQDYNNIKNKIYNFISSVASNFIVMICIFFILPKTKDSLNKIKIDTNQIIKNIGIGLIAIIIIPIISLIALISGILTPLALITIALYIIFIYLASLIVCYIIGKLLVEKWIEKNNTYLSLLIGIILIKIIKLIPTIGPIISALVLFYGMGLIYNYIISIKKNNK